MKRTALAVVLVLLAWTLVDALAHRALLEPLYLASPQLWRPPDQINGALVIAATVTLAMVIAVTYRWLVRPRSLASGVSLGGLFGVALGAASGLGTYIHSPIPAALAWGWFSLGAIKGVMAGAILGAVTAKDPP